MSDPQIPSQNLGNIITSPTARKSVYGTYAIACVAATATQVGYAAIQAPQPDWLSVALAVLAYLGIPLAGLALSNTPKKES